MAELKTKPTRASVSGYYAAIADDVRRQDCKALAKADRESHEVEAKDVGPEHRWIWQVSLQV